MRKSEKRRGKWSSSGERNGVQRTAWLRQVPPTTPPHGLLAYQWPGTARSVSRENQNTLAGPRGYSVLGSCTLSPIETLNQCSPSAAGNSNWGHPSSSPRLQVGVLRSGSLLNDLVVAVCAKHRYATHVVTSPSSNIPSLLSKSFTAHFTRLVQPVCGHSRDLALRNLSSRTSPP